MEEWKDIYYFDFIKNEWIDYRELYQINRNGKIKSLNYNRTGKEKILKERKNQKGYLLINLFKNGKGKQFQIHRIVSFMFIENDDKINKIEVNHKDENKSNNCVENLEWCTHKYNTNYGNRNEKISKLQKGKKISEEHKQKVSKKIICITTGEIFNSMREAERKTGVPSNRICECCKEKRKSAGKSETGEKLVWRYLE